MLYSHGLYANCFILTTVKTFEVVWSVLYEIAKNCHVSASKRKMGTFTTQVQVELCALAGIHKLMLFLVSGVVVVDCQTLFYLPSTFADLAQMQVFS